MKFMGPAVADPAHAEYFNYFLDPKNHQPGIPIDMLSYHMFLYPDADESAEVMSYSFFQQADKFLLAAAYIEELRRRLIPKTGTDVVDIATMLPDPLAPTLARPIPRSYWSLSAGVFAYLYGKLALLGVDAVGASELIDSPGIVAASTLVDWQSGRPNARYWALKMLHENFGPKDALVRSPSFTSLQPDPTPWLYAQAFIDPHGNRKILLVNKRQSRVSVRIPGAPGGSEQHVDEATEASPARRPLTRDTLRPEPFAVAVVTLPH
jgi:hypothetical protein